MRPPQSFEQFCTVSWQNKDSICRSTVFSVATLIVERSKSSFRGFVHLLQTLRGMIVLLLSNVSLVSTR